MPLGSFKGLVIFHILPFSTSDKFLHTTTGEFVVELLGHMRFKGYVTKGQLWALMATVRHQVSNAGDDIHSGC